MEEEEGSGPRLSKRFSDKGEGEVDYKTKSGTAWSHSYLNQKPWHPLSYPNQRRKWIAEQTHSQRQRRAQEVAREYAQEQEFFRQTALVSKKEKEKMEMMKAVSFMYVRPPGYNAESAKSAELDDEQKNQEAGNSSQDPPVGVAPINMLNQPVPHSEQKKKPRPKDVFGRALPTEEQFEVLKNAPRLETGVAARSKPFGVEIRNVKCLRCGNFGHQSGDRECPLKDAIMPNEESRLRRDDPLTTIVAQTESSVPLKWELKQKPGMSPPRGGYRPDDPNQQIVAEDIFDEYGGFLGAGGERIPELLTNLSTSKHKKKSHSKRKHKGDWLADEGSEGDGSNRKKHKKRSRKHSGLSDETLSSDDYDKGRRSKAKKSKSSKLKHFESSSPDCSSLPDDNGDEERERKSRERKNKKNKCKASYLSSPDDSEIDGYCKGCVTRRKGSRHSRENSDSDGKWSERRHRPSNYRHR